jgi:hypothetical protein
MRICRALACLALLTSGTTGCPAWRQVSVSPAALETEPKELRVTHADGTRLVLYDPEITADSVIGTTEGHRLAMSLEEVSRIAVPSASKSQHEAGTTFVGSAVAAFGAWLLIAVVSN